MTAVEAIAARPKLAGITTTFNARCAIPSVALKDLDSSRPCFEDSVGNTALVIEDVTGVKIDEQNTKAAALQVESVVDRS